MGLTTNMLTQIKTAIKDDIEAEFTYGAIGTDSTAFSTSQTALLTEVFRDAVDEVDKSDASKIVVSLRVLTTEANGNTIVEAGFLDAATTGTLHTRNVLTGISKTSSKQLYFDVEVTITTEEV